MAGVRRSVVTLFVVASTIGWARPAPEWARAAARSPGQIRLHLAAQGAPAAATRKADFNGDGFADAAIGVPFEDIGSTEDTGAIGVIYGSSTGLTSASNQLLYEGNGVPGTAQTGDAYGFALAAGDFNADGYADLAVGMPGKTVGTQTNAGAVNILYGSSLGLTSSGSQVWQQGTGGLPDVAEAGDLMGYEVAAGDLNGDGYADLAVAAIGESVGAVAEAGAVSVLYGSPGGLSATGNQFWTEDATGLDPSEPGDRFGISLVVGDFNRDGYSELAAGLAYEDLGAIRDAGAVLVLAGTAGGLTSAGGQFWTQDSSGIIDATENGDGFGYALAAGDLNGDLYPDLVAGIPGESLGSVALAGAIGVILGSAAGLISTGNQFFDQDSANVPGTAETEDEFGTAVAVGDFNRDGKDDVAIGSPYEDIGSIGDAGAVNVLYGTSSGATGTGSQLWYQGNGGLAGTSQDGDLFGSALTAQNFGSGKKADLLVGLPGDLVKSADNAGSALVMYGTSGGLSATGNRVWNQNSTDIQGTAEADDSFGWDTAGAPGTSSASASPVREALPTAG
jgi:hypothetical protein